MIFEENIIQCKIHFWTITFYAKVKVGQEGNLAYDF